MRFRMMFVEAFIFHRHFLFCRDAGALSAQQSKLLGQEGSSRKQNQTYPPTEACSDRGRERRERELTCCISCFLRYKCGPIRLIVPKRNTHHVVGTSWEQRQLFPLICLARWLFSDLMRREPKSQLFAVGDRGHSCSTFAVVCLFL